MYVFILVLCIKKLQTGNCKCLISRTETHVACPDSRVILTNKKENNY
jgi:hypothetical protein